MEKRKTIIELRPEDKIWIIIDQSVLGSITECIVTTITRNTFVVSDDKKEYTYAYQKNDKTSYILHDKPVNYGDSYIGKIFINYIDALQHKRDVVRKLLEEQSKVFEETYQAIIKELKN